MKKLIKANSNKEAFIEEAYVLTPRNRLLKRYPVGVTVLIAFILLAGAWAVKHFYIEPMNDSKLISKALQQLESTVIGKEKVQALSRSSESDRVARTYQILMPSTNDAEISNRVAGYFAALRTALRMGIPEAKLSYGIALRDGLLGKRDSASALKIFDEVGRDMEPGVRAGDPVAMYVIAKMYKEGLGKPSDPHKAVELVKRAVNGLDGWRLEAVGYDLALGLDDGFFKGHQDTDLVAKIATRLIERKLESGPKIGSLSCVESDPAKKILCIKGWYEQAVNSNIYAAIPEYTGYLIKTGSSLDNVDNWFTKGATYSSPYYRYRHAVVKAMLASDDFSLLLALREMRAQIQADDKRADKLSLSDGFFVLHDFGVAIASQKSNAVDNFLIANNVSGIFTGSLESNQKELHKTLGRPDLLTRAKSSEIIRKSEIAARAIIDNLPLAQVNISEATKSTKSAEAIQSLKISSLGKTQKDVEKTAPLARDPEQQEQTGYIKGQPQIAVGGLSTFTVDNRQGDRDAVARIYLNGNKPAVRSMYVKHGELFKADEILPGTYVFRYRFIGSQDTYESKKDFSISQTETETGTRYSTVRVTLFKVRDGNMSTQKVDPNSF